MANVGASRWRPENASGRSCLYYYRARYYSSALGRFISEDPSQFQGGTNFYAYVGGGPTNYVDPLGKAWDLPSLPQGFVDTAAGIGDSLLFNQGARLRSLLDINSVNVCASGYGTGMVIGFVRSLATGEGEVNLVFKTEHYAERLIAAGVDVANAESAVAREINAIETALVQGERIQGQLTVDGVLLQYRAMPLPSCTVSVGTIHPVW